MVTAEPWIVFRHIDYDKIVGSFLATYLKDPDRWPFGPIVYHIEPYEVFKRQPFLNPVWRFWGIVTGSEAAFRFIQDEEDRWITALEERQHNDISAGLRYDIMKRDRFKCQICGRSAQDGVKMEIDHITPRAKGGSSKPDNLRVLCFDCNRGKSDKTP